mmetsp:Transcript_26531/g.47648  ORF Transcript_26531/g.47648 Transcript_26531/m.47648 type:complete len:387 (+) Transcript_26531:192-1352(+)
MLGNGVCDSVCMNLMCGNDDTDCSCSPRRTSTPALIAGHARLMSTAATKTRIIGISIPVTRFVTVRLASSQLDSASSRASKTASFAYGANNWYYLRYVDGKMQFFSYCLDMCPRGYESHPIIPSLCVEKAQASSEEVYVTSTQTGNNLGTAEDPLWSLAEAIYSSSLKETTIRVLAGTHTLAMKLNSPVFSVIDTANSNPLEKLNKLKISGLMCSTDETHPQCASETPTIHLTDPTFSMTFKGQAVTLKDLTFDASVSLVEGCSLESCKYCPSVTTSDTETLDDRGETLTQFASSSLCSSFSETNFISISGAESSLTISDVSFSASAINLLRFSPSQTLRLLSLELSSLTLKPLSSQLGVSTPSSKSVALPRPASPSVFLTSQSLL